MSCNGTSNVEERVIFDAEEHLNTVSGTNVVSFIRKITKIISFKGQEAGKFTVRKNKVVTFTTACVTFISRTVIEKRLEMYAKQPEQLIKDLGYIFKLFLK